MDINDLDNILNALSQKTTSIFYVVVDFRKNKKVNRPIINSALNLQFMD